MKAEDITDEFLMKELALETYRVLIKLDIKFGEGTAKRISEMISSKGENFLSDLILNN